MCACMCVRVCVCVCVCSQYMRGGAKNGPSAVSAEDEQVTDGDSEQGVRSPFMGENFPYD